MGSQLNAPTQAGRYARISTKILADKRISLKKVAMVVVKPSIHLGTIFGDEVVTHVIYDAADRPIVIQTEICAWVDNEITWQTHTFTLQVDPNCDISDDWWCVPIWMDAARNRMIWFRGL